MGDPRKQRRKYRRPQNPWKAERIAEESEIIKKYGLKNNREIWRAKASVGRFRQQARALLVSSGPQVETEKKQLLDKLNRLGILKSNLMEDVLALTVNEVLERRLQTMVFKKGLANSPRQARQMVVHGHVVVGSKITTIPGFTVSVEDEDTIKLADKIAVKAASEYKKEKKEKVESGGKTEEVGEKAAAAEAEVKQA